MPVRNSQETWGRPFIRIYPISPTSTATVSAAQKTDQTAEKASFGRRRFRCRDRVPAGVKAVLSFLAIDPHPPLGQRGKGNVDDHDKDEQDQADAE